MSEFTDERIKSIINQYEKKREKEKARYALIKDTPDFIKQNRDRARSHYENNKDTKKERYESDKEFLNCKASYYYYRRINRLDLLKEKHPDKIKILAERNIIV